MSTRAPSGIAWIRAQIQLLYYSFCSKLSFFIKPKTHSSRVYRLFAQKLISLFVNGFTISCLSFSPNRRHCMPSIDCSQIRVSLTKKRFVSLHSQKHFLNHKGTIIPTRSVPTPGVTHHDVFDYKSFLFYYL